MIARRRLRSLSAPKVAALSSGLGAGLVAALIGLSACSGDSAAPEVTVVRAAAPTTFRTEPVRTTTTTIAPPPTVAEEGSGSGSGDEPDGTDGATDDPGAERSYEIQPGDYLVRIAQNFDVTADAIVAYNGWDSLQHDLQPGDTIRIPPEDWDPDEASPATTGDAAETDGEENGACPDGSAPDTYTIQAGDVKGTVARRFGVTVAELDAANAGTQYYSGFVIGIDIVIPC